MPNEQYKKIYENVSKEDFDNKFVYIRDMDDKFDFICSYILSYGFRGRQESLELVDLIDHVKTRFIEASLHKKQEYDFLASNPKKYDATDINPYEMGKKPAKELMEKEFVSDPLKFLKKHAKDLGANMVVSKELDERWMNHCKDLSSRILNYSDEYEETKEINRVQNVKKRFCANSGFVENVDLNIMLDSYKGGVFERFFNTTSEEYRVFKATLEAFNNDNSEAYGDLDKLEGATRAYLYHKLPNFNSLDKLPEEADVKGLTGTSKKRVNLCINVLKSIYEQRKQDEMSDKLKELDLFPDIKDHKSEVQESIKNDVELDFSKIVDDKSKAKVSNNIIDNKENEFQKNLNNKLDEDVKIHKIVNEIDEELSENDINNNDLDNDI